MEQLKERIELLISTKGMTNATFAEKIGVQPSNISHVLSGRNKPSLDLVMKILHSFKELRTEWLLHGQGSMTSDYTLFDLDEVEKKPEPEPKSQHKESKIDQEISKKEIPELFEVKTAEKQLENVENVQINKDGNDVADGGEKNEKRNPHKKPGKSIERIVIFYEDKSFSEYFPEG